MSSKRRGEFKELSMTIIVGSCLQCGRPRFDPWVGKIPWRRKRQPTPVFMPGKSHGPSSLVSYSPWGRKESDTTEQLHFTSLHHFRSSQIYTFWHPRTFWLKKPEVRWGGRNQNEESYLVRLVPNIPLGHPLAVHPCCQRCNREAKCTSHISFHQLQPQKIFKVSKEESERSTSRWDHGKVGVIHLT